jgi:hypothetical protein
VATVLASEFFWGIVIGLILALISGYALAKFTSSEQIIGAKRTVKSFAIDVIRNIKSIDDELEQTRDKGKVIHPDYLALLDVEIGVFGRNREHLLHLPDDLRNKVRKFVNDVGIRRAEIGSQLALFEQSQSQANALNVQGSGPQAQREFTKAAEHLNAAHAAAAKLANVISGADAIIASLTAFKPRRRLIRG